MTDKNGARASHQALAVPVEPQERLAPLGFDPSRFAVLCRTVGKREAVAVSYMHSLEHFDEMLEMVAPYGKSCEYTAIPRGCECEGKEWLQRTIDSAADLPWVRREELNAIAMEARQRRDAEAGVPDVVRQAASQHWPPVLHGIEVAEMIVFIEAEAQVGTADALQCYEMFWSEEQEDKTWIHLQADHLVAHLRELEIASIDLPEHGVADPDVAAGYATLTSKAPPILVVGNQLQDGNHRVEAAQQRGETHILAYVVEGL